MNGLMDSPKTTLMDWLINAVIDIPKNTLIASPTKILINSSIIAPIDSPMNARIDALKKIVFESGILGVRFPLAPGFFFSGRVIPVT